MYYLTLNKSNCNFKNIIRKMKYCNNIIHVPNIVINMLC